MCRQSGEMHKHTWGKGEVWWWHNTHRLHCVTWVIVLPAFLRGGPAPCWCLLSILSKVRRVLATSLGDNSMDRNTQNQPRSPLFLGKGEREGGKNVLFCSWENILYKHYFKNLPYTYSNHLFDINCFTLIKIFLQLCTCQSWLEFPSAGKRTCRPLGIGTENSMWASAQVFFSSPRKRKGSCFQHGYLCLMFKVFPFFCPFMILSIWLQVVANKWEYICARAPLEDSCPVSGFF